MFGRKLIREAREQLVDPITDEARIALMSIDKTLGSIANLAAAILMISFATLLVVSFASAD